MGAVSQIKDLDSTSTIHYSPFTKKRAAAFPQQLFLNYIEYVKLMPIWHAVDNGSINYNLSKGGS